MTSPRFSVIIPHYQGSIDHDTFLRGVNSILNQTCKDYEIICIHDGPLLTKEEFPVEVICTQKRYNNWGHSLRDWGIRKAEGEYIIHFNPDNILTPNALEILSSYSDDILIFEVDMMGMEECPQGRFYSDPRDLSKKITITGNPVAYGNIDCMQLVMKRKKWYSLGGWYDKSEQSDFAIYTKATKECAPTYVPHVLGEHY
jgi:glycosyltransferase involved in cell wall biosynthesis